MRFQKRFGDGPAFTVAEAHHVFFAWSYTAIGQVIDQAGFLATQSEIEAAAALGVERVGISAAGQQRSEPFHPKRTNAVDAPVNRCLAMAIAQMDVCSLRQQERHHPMSVRSGFVQK